MGSGYFRRPIWVILTLLLFIVHSAQSSAASVAAQSGDRRPLPDWRTDLQYQIRFKKILRGSHILVGTERHTFAVDMLSGATLWRFRNVDSREGDIFFVPSEDLILIAEGWGGRFEDQESTLLAVELESGEIRWESKVFQHRILSATPDPENRHILLVSARQPHDEKGDTVKRELGLHLLDMRTGKLQWEARLDEKIQLTPSTIIEYDDDDDMQLYTLEAFHEPRFDGPRVYLFYKGVHCYDVASGELLWDREFDVLADDDLSLSYAEPLIDERLIYTVRDERLRAYRSRDGEEAWKTDDFGTIAAVQFDDSFLYLQLGGRFYKAEDTEWESKGPYGVAVVNRNTGKKIWKWDDGDESITNLLIFGDRVYLADGDDLIAIDRYTGKRLYKDRHRFDEAPRFIGLNEAQELVLIGDENVAAYRPGDGKRLWFHNPDPPGISFWKKLAAGFLASTGAVLAVASYGLALQNSLLPAIPSPVNRVFNYRRGVVRLGQAAGKGLVGAGVDLLQKSRYAQLTGNHQYFFTKIDEIDEEGLIGVNLNTGRIDHVLPLKKEELVVLVSEPHQKVIQSEGSALTAYNLQRMGERPRIQ